MLLRRYIQEFDGARDALGSYVTPPSDQSPAYE